MKESGFTEVQILGVLRQMEGGVPAAELCREHGMSSATLYKWRAKYGGMDASLISEMKAMAANDPLIIGTAFPHPLSPSLKNRPRSQSRLFTIAG